MIALILSRLSQLSHWQIDFLVTGILLEGAVFTIFPEEVVISALGILWGLGKVDFFEAMISVQLGLLPANVFLVFIGQTFGARLLLVRPFVWLLKGHAVERALAKLRRYGSWLIVMTRFTPFVRAPMYFATGVSRFGILRFMRTDALASCAQVPLWLWLGRTLGQNSNNLLDAYRRLGIGMAVLFVLVLVGLGSVRLGDENAPEKLIR